MTLRILAARLLVTLGAALVMLPTSLPAQFTNSMTAPALSAPQCDPSLWAHVYAGRFARPQDRLRVVHPCVTVTGYIDARHPPRPEPDGDWHIQVRLDPPFAGMLNAANHSQQYGDLIVEPVCANPVSEPDALREGVCQNFSQQQVFHPAMIGRHVQITGVFVTDMGHGWNEIHPVTSIVPIP